MNLKAIDAAITAYRPQLTDDDNARLAFFRELWDVQASLASRVAEAGGFTVPDAVDLRAWAQAELPVLAQAPASLDAELFADALERIAAVLSAHEGFSASTQEALKRVKWDRIVAASDLAQAGSDPAAYLEAFAALLVDDGMHEDAAHTGALAASLALRALLEEPARAIQAARQEAGVDEVHSLRCPVCGGSATLARVGAADVAQGGGKELWCAQCGTAWEFERVRCGRCGTQNQGHLHYFNLEGDEAHRLATCDECGGYVRTVYQTDALAPFSFEVEDVVMAKLDLVAYQRAAADVSAQAQG